MAMKGGKHSRTLSALLLLPLMLPAGALAERGTDTLRLVISNSLPPPYLVEAEDGREPAGMAVDLCRKVAERLGYGAQIQAVPPKRLPELVRAGEADMVCHVSASWYPRPDDLWFGTRLYNAGNVFIAAANAPAICPTCELPPEVATVASYEYGDRIRQAVASGRVQRHDVRSEENVFRLVQGGRVAYGIISEYTFRYLLMGGQGLAIKGELQRYDITVGVTRRGTISEADLKTASASIHLPEDVTPEYRPFLGKLDEQH